MATRDRSEDGLTLVELIVTVAIMGIAFLAVLGGMWTAIVTSDTHRKQSLAAGYLIDVGEYLKDNDATLYAPCGTYSIPSGLVPANWAASMAVDVTYWDGTAFVAATQSACSTNPRIGLYNLQKLKITATSPVEARAIETLTVLKRAA